MSVSHTVWVSVVPVVFAASAGLELDESWGWRVCDSDLSAMVEVLPNAAVSFQGSVEVNLLVIKAGMRVKGSFRSALTPSATLHGTECNLEMKADLASLAVDAVMEGYYNRKKCKFLIFDCHWGDVQTRTFWEDSITKPSRALVDETFPIPHK